MLFPLPMTELLQEPGDFNTSMVEPRSLSNYNMVEPSTSFMNSYDPDSLA